MRRTPPFSLLTFPCNAVEINSDLYDENAAMVLKSTKRVKKMFFENSGSTLESETVVLQSVSRSHRDRSDLYRLPTRAQLPPNPARPDDLL